MKRTFLLRTAIVFICLCGCLTAIAQVCTGSLGDAQINVNFGSGSNPGLPLQAATTTYNFTSTNCPGDGFYTVVNNSAGCFGNTWHTLSEDHTPNDANGFMMLVNASFNPGDFYVDTVKNLCANTTYEFAAWITNVLLPTACMGNGILPNLVFKIETTAGKVLGTYSTGGIAMSSTPSWKQYGLFFTTPFNTNDVVIRLANTAPGGCGNDIALDDITFRPCGPTVTTSTANNNLTLVDLCTGNISSTQVIANIGNGYVVPSSQWQESNDNGISWVDIAGQTSLTYQFNKTAIGVYKYRLSVAEGANINITSCRVASNPVSITIHDKPVITATGNSPVCEKRVISLTPSGGATYTWSGPAGFSSTLAAPSLIAQNNSGGQYNVTGTDQYGCKNSASVDVVVNPKPTTVVSNTQQFCEGNSVTLQASGGINYLWSPAVGLSNVNIANPVASPADSTIYSVIITSANNCADTATVAIHVFKKPTANAGPDKIIFKGQSVVLQGMAGGGNTTATWSPPAFLNDPLLLQPTATALSDMRFTLNVISNAGCGEASDDVFVKVVNGIYVPTAFSPNNDRLNDTWRIDALLALPNARVLIFNRYGKIIFESTGSNAVWDGTYKGNALPSGAYAYMIDLKNGKPLLKGMVMLVR